AGYDRTQLIFGLDHELRRPVCLVKPKRHVASQKIGVSGRAVPIDRVPGARQLFPYTLSPVIPKHEMTVAGKDSVTRTVQQDGIARRRASIVMVYRDNLVRVPNRQHL